MIKRYLHIVLLAMLFVPLASCDRLIYDDRHGCDNPDAKGEVHLSVKVVTPQFSSTLRAMESINKDVTYYEDAVHSLAMLVFNSTSGEKIGAYFNSNVGSGTPSTLTFNIKMLPGNYDFYFVANVANMESELNSVADRNAMDQYMEKAGRELTEALYTGANASAGFPMSRVYKGQVVTAGGTVYQPKPFKPQVDSEDLDKVVATYGTETREWVELMRAVAKLELELIAGENTMTIDKIYFRNANRHCSLTTPKSVPTAYFSDKINQKELKKDDKTGKYYFYMPEVISSSSTPSWTDNTDNKPINYFTVTTTTGHQFDIPIISDNSSIDYDGQYIAKATGKVSGYKPDYNVYRNHKYIFKLRNPHQLEVAYQVAPWDLVEAFTYMGYGYRVDLKSDGNITITNTIDDCLPNKVILVAKNGAHFGRDASEVVQPTEPMKEYGFSEATDPGYSADKTKAGYSETFKMDLSGVTAGQVYLEIYYNKKPASGVTPDKTFTKK